MSNQDVPYSIVDSTPSVLALLEAVQDLPRSTESLYIDLEGIKLSRHGTISLLTVFVEPKNHVYLIDVHTLKSRAFTTATITGLTLKSILESPTIFNVFFDLRNNSDALHKHFDIYLQGVQDVQLMKNATRPTGQRHYVNGFGRCINRDAYIPASLKSKWKANKDKGLELFHPSKGGSYEVFNERPIPKIIERYCVNDVRFLPQLRNLYWRRLNSTWQRKVAKETEKRVRESQSTLYQPQSEDKKYGPWETPGQAGFLWL